MHESLEPVLRRTLGVPLFQEQLLRMAMIAAGFSGGEAEELRRAFGFKRSEQRMQEVEVKLRYGMERNSITGATQDAIVQSIASFALYGFPESHAASFALLAYASAYLKCHYLAAFTAALLNNQPMGFYHPSTIVKDAQRHGLRVMPIDILRSNWPCTIEEQPEPDKTRDQNAYKQPCQRKMAKSLRLGLRYVKGLREQAALAIERERGRQSFTTIDELARRVPELRQDEIRKLAEIGALNSIGAGDRRDALWQAERAGRPAGALLDELPEPGAASPLAPMSRDERLVTDFRSTGMTIGPHPMAYRRSEMQKLRVSRAIDLQKIPNGKPVRVAGCVICRQRPGTAKGFLFLSLEDETGIANAIVTPDLFATRRSVLVNEPFLLVDGVLQNQDGVISVKAQRVQPLVATEAATESHDFH
jgi:error-prone DNA polymerase